MKACRLPAEWEPQSGVMLTWPHGHGDWAPYLESVEPVFVQIAKHISLREKLVISGYDAAYCRHIEQLLTSAGALLDNMRIFPIHSDDTWARDHGPITVLHDGQPYLLDYVFNGWGGKYSAEQDNAITRQLIRYGAFGTTPSEEIDLILEGGSIESDGEGRLLTTSQCLLSKGRNPQLDRQQIEQALQTQLGVDTVLWLEHGALEGDDTDSHIDTLARFCDPHTIAYVASDNPEDSHYPELKAMEAELQAFRDADGSPYRLVPLPMPAAHINEDGQRLPATYANFLIINGAVLVPTYADAADELALQQLQTCFPEREIIGIDSSPLIQQFGSLHCVTMQLPQGVII